jgi:hypothetical protein
LRFSGKKLHDDDGVALGLARAGRQVVELALYELNLFLVVRPTTISPPDSWACNTPAGGHDGIQRVASHNLQSEDDL